MTSCIKDEIMQKDFLYFSTSRCWMILCYNNHLTPELLTDDIYHEMEEAIECNIDNVWGNSK